jgi:hypothetical protein
MPAAAPVALKEGGLALRDAVTGELLASLPTTGERSHLLAISGDRRFIASAGESAAVRVWDTSADPGEQERERVWISPLLAPGGRAVALNSGDHLEIWDVAAERRLPVQRPPGLPQRRRVRRRVAGVQPGRRGRWRRSHPARAES